MSNPSYELPDCPDLALAPEIAAPPAEIPPEAAHALYRSTSQLIGQNLPFSEADLHSEPDTRRRVNEFLNRLCDVQIILRQHRDPERLVRDVKVLRLEWAGHSTASILAAVDGKHWENMNRNQQRSERAHLNTAANRLARTLHQFDDYSSSNLARLLEQHMRGATEQIALPSVGTVPRRPGAKAPAEKSEHEAVEHWLTYGEVGNGEVSRKLLTIFLLEDVVMDRGVEEIRQSLRSLRAKIREAKNYRPSAAASENFKRAVALKESDTELLNNTLLIYDEVAMLSGFARICSQRPEHPAHTLRQRIIHDLRRIVIIASPDEPPKPVPVPAKHIPNIN